MPSSTESSQSIAVIGGGIGGLAVAQLLRHAGYPTNSIHIYEARSTPQMQQQTRVGNGIHLYFCAVRMLLNGGVPDLAQYLKPAHVHFRRDDGRVIVSVNRQRQVQLDPELQKTKTSCYTILRPLLYKALLDVTPPETVHCNKKCVAIAPGDHPEEAPTIHFADGTSVQADLIIGADGIHSKVASYVHPQNQKRKLIPWGGTMVQGYSTYRLVDETAEAWILHRDGSSFGLMASVLPDGTTGSWWWVTSAADDDTTRTQEDYLAFVRDQATKYSWSECAHVMASTVPESIERWSMADKDPLPADRWVSSDGRIVLLGDACHAALPTTGYGAGMTIEDAHWLVRTLGPDPSVVHDHPERLARLRRYAGQRAPWTTAIVKEGRWLIRASHTQNRILRTLVNLGWSSGIPDKIVARKFVRIFRRGLDETEWTEEETAAGVLAC